MGLCKDLAIKLANAAANLIADGSTPQDFLTYFGRCFIRAAGPFQYETLIKVTKKNQFHYIFQFNVIDFIRLNRTQKKLIPVYPNQQYF